MGVVIARGISAIDAAPKCWILPSRSAVEMSRALRRWSNSGTIRWRRLLGRTLAVQRPSTGPAPQKSRGTLDMPSQRLRSIPQEARFGPRTVLPGYDALHYADTQA